MKLARGSLIQMMPVCVRGHLEITFFFFKCSEDLKWNLPPGRENCSVTEQGAGMDSQSKSLTWLWSVLPIFSIISRWGPIVMEVL